MFGPIHNALGERLDYTFHPGSPHPGDHPGGRTGGQTGGQTGRRDLVVIGHGVTANKDRPFLVALAEGLAATGLAVLRFSFSGNGESDGKFTAATVSKEVADLGTVLDTLDGWRVAYAGHSQGGAVGVLRASADPRIRALVSLAGMVHTEAFARRKFGAQTPGHAFMWDKPDCPLSQAYMDDMAAIGSVAEQASAVRVPWLLVHGSADDVVPLQDALDIRARSGNHATLVQLEGADHVFSGDATTAMVDPVVSWFADQW